MASGEVCVTVWFLACDDRQFYTLKYKAFAQMMTITEKGITYFPWFMNSGNLSQLKTPVQPHFLRDEKFSTVPQVLRKWNVETITLPSACDKHLFFFVKNIFTKRKFLLSFKNALNALFFFLFINYPELHMVPWLHCLQPDASCGPSQPATAWAWPGPGGRCQATNPGCHQDCQWDLGVYTDLKLCICACSQYK